MDDEYGRIFDAQTKSFPSIRDTGRAAMTRLKLDRLHWVLFIALGSLLLVFWLTPYSYHQNAGILVRIHRVQGNDGTT